MAAETQNLSGWIWTGEPDAALNREVQIVYFRKELELVRLPEKFTAQLSADSRYKFYVNGQIVEVGPEKGDNQVWFYETVNLLPHVTVGKNVLAAVVLRYPLIDKKGNYGIWRTETPGFYFKGAMAGPDGSVQEVLADSSWEFRHAEQIHIVSESQSFAPLQIFEQAEGRAWELGWRQAGYQADGWMPAAPYVGGQVRSAVSPGNLLPRPIPSLYQKERRFPGVVTMREIKEERPQILGNWERLLREDAPLSIPAHSREVVEIDAGELTTGYLTLALAGGSGAGLHILYSESYAKKQEKEGSQGTEVVLIKEDRTDWQHGQLYGYADDYRVAGYGEEHGGAEVYEPFWFRTFRFLQLKIETGDFPLTIRKINYRETGYPLQVQTWVETSDPTLREVWNISERTLRRCMHETYEDCPFYEQLQYSMDSRSQMLFTYQVAADDRLARKCMDDFKRSARYDGLLNCSYPCYGPNVIPGFSIYYILMLYDHMMYFGDKELIRYHMPTVDGILEYFRRNLNARGLVGKTGGYNGRARYWSFIDWVDGWESGVPGAVEYGPITMESFLYLYGLQAAGRLAEYVGRNDVAGEYRKRAQAVQASVRRDCIGKNGLYQDGPGVEEYSQHCQVFAVLTGTAEPEEGKRLLREVTDFYYGNGKEYPRCSVAMAYYMFRALEKAGLYERTERLWDVWREMVRNRLTTCVENSTDGRSDCHAWGSLILYELPAVVLGVRPAAPGYEKISVSPRMGYYTHAQGRVITPKGFVRVSWKKGPDGNPQVEWSLEGQEKRGEAEALS